MNSLFLRLSIWTAVDSLFLRLNLALVGQASDSMTALTQSFSRWVVA